MSNFLDIGAVNDVPQQGARRVKTDDGIIAIFRTTTDKIFAVDDMCPGKAGPLSNGIQHGEAVTCPIGNWVFDLNTGEAQGADDGQISTYATKVEDGRILLNPTAS